MVRHSLRAAVLAFAVMLTGPGSAQTSDASPMVVYDTALAPDWHNYSWAKVELSVELNGSARKPIAVDAGPWAAFYLQHDAISLAAYKTLHMLVQGSQPGGDVRIFTLTGGKTNGEGHLVKLNNTGWTQIDLPLKQLGADGKLVDGIWVQNSSAETLPRFYVTEISFR